MKNLSLKDDKAFVSLAYNIALPNNFLKVLATMRSRNMSANIIIQNIAQIKALFKDDWESLTGNCDVLVYLGGNELGTHEYISKLLGKWTIDKKTTGETRGSHGSSSRNYDVLGREIMTPDEVRKMDNSQCLVFIKGMDAVLDDKYHTWEKQEFKNAAIAEQYQGKKALEQMEHDGQFRFYIDCKGERGQIDSLWHQIEDYHCVFEESEAFKMISANELEGHYLCLDTWYDPDGNLTSSVIPAFSKTAEEIVAAGTTLRGHRITGFFKKNNPNGKFDLGNLYYSEATPEEIRRLFIAGYHHKKSSTSNSKTVYDTN